MTDCVYGMSDQEAKGKHSIRKLGQGHEQEIQRSNNSSDNYVCVPTKCLADSKILPGSRFYCEEHFACLITFNSRNDTLR